MYVFSVVLLSTLKLPQKSIRSTENGFIFPEPVKNPKCILCNEQHNRSINEQYSSNYFPNPYNLWDIVPPDLMSLFHANDRYSMSNQFPQTTTHQLRIDSYPEFSSLRTMDRERKRLRVSFAFLQENYSRTDK